LAEYKAEANPTIRFFEDYLSTGENCSIDSKRLYLVYRHWCEQEGHHPLNDRAFGKQLLNKFSEAQKKRVRVGKNLAWQYSGISWTVDEIFGKQVEETLFD